MRTNCVRTMCAGGALLLCVVAGAGVAGARWRLIRQRVRAHLRR